MSEVTLYGLGAEGSGFGSKDLSSGNGPFQDRDGAQRVVLLCRGYSKTGSHTTRRMVLHAPTCM